jgi:type VI secretion system protein VasJ
VNEALTSFLDPASVDFSTGVNGVDRHAYVLAASARPAGPDPCGEPADAHEIFQDIEAETIKRGTLRQGQIRWKFVETESARLLTQCKDLRILVALLHSLAHEETHQRFALALQIAATFLSRFAKDAHPRSRLKPKLAGRLAEALEQLTPKTGADFEEAGILPGCCIAARVCANALAEVAPEVGLTLAGLPARLEALNAPPKSRLEQAGSRSGVDGASRQPASSENIPGQAAPRPESLRLELDNERALRQSLSVVADFMLRLDLANPLSYRLRRYATWFGVVTPPPIRAGQRTVLTPVSEDAIDRYRAAVDRGQADLDMIQRLERSCHLQPFWLEGQWLAFRLAQAAGRSGVADAIRAEVGRFFTALPAIRTLCFADGSPMMPDEVAHWLTAPAPGSQASPADTGSESPDVSGGPEGDMQALSRNARTLAKQGDLAAALASLDQARLSARSPRVKTLWEVTLIEMLNEFGLKSHAQTQAQRLRETIGGVPATEWEPELFRRLTRLEGRK